MVLEYRQQFGWCGVSVQVSGAVEDWINEPFVQPKPRAALGAARPCCLYSGHRWRGAGEAERWVS
jgi:hypothetical protein